MRSAAAIAVRMLERPRRAATSPATSTPAATTTNSHRSRPTAPGRPIVSISWRIVRARIEGRSLLPRSWAGNVPSKSPVSIALTRYHAEPT